MEHLPASDAKREFGEVLMRVQKEPVGISRNGKPVAVVMSAREYEELLALKEAWLRAELLKGLDSRNKGQVVDGKAALGRLKQQVSDASL